MANQFVKVAHRATTLSQLMEGRDAIKTEDLIRDFPEGITIIGFDIVNAGLSTYPVVIFEEDTTKYYNGGTILANICEGWAALYDGDIESASKSLAASGGVKMRLEQSRTKTGNNITVPHIID